MSQPAAPDAVSPSRAPARDIRLVLGTMSFWDTADLETARAAIDMRLPGLIVIQALLAGIDGQIG